MALSEMKENWERKRQAWLLRAKGLTYKEIGKQLGGISRSRAYQLVGRFNRQLDRMIEPERDQAQGDAQVIAAFSQAKREPCNRAATIIKRAVNCGWIKVLDLQQLHANLRVALDTEVEAGGPYLNSGMKCERCGLRRGRWWHDTFGLICSWCRTSLAMTAGKGNV